MAKRAWCNTFIASGNVSFTFDGVERLTNFERECDFAIFEPGAIITVNFAAWQVASVAPPCVIRWKIRVGGTLAVVDGDVVFNQQFSTLATAGLGDPINGSATFSNIYSGPRMVRITGQGTGFNSLAFTPKIVFFTT